MSGKRAKAIRKAIKQQIHGLPDAKYKAPVYKRVNNAAGACHLEYTEQEFPVNKERRLKRAFQADQKRKRHGK